MRYQELFPVDEYIERLFIPSLDRCSVSSGNDALTARLMLFEALRWLELGVDLHVFPVSVGRALVKEYHLPLREQYRQFPTELHYLLPEVSQVHLRKMMDNQELSGGYNFEASASISMQFQLLVELVGRFNAHGGATSLSTGFLFLRDSEWTQFISVSVGTDQILPAMSETAHVWFDGHRPYIFAGYFQAIRHFEDMLEALDFKHRPEEVDGSNWAFYRQTIHEIHGWRFDLRRPGYLSRFTDVSRLLGKTIAQELDGNGVAIDDSGFIDYLRDLTVRWRGLGEPLSRSAMSSRSPF